MSILKPIVRAVLKWVYRIELIGQENFDKAGVRVLIIANHTSFLDAVLLAVFLPGKITFAINTYIARLFWLKPFLGFVDVYPMDPTNPLSTKGLIRHIQEDRKAVIFPEGRITVTGSLMKIYQGPGLVADKSGASLLPVRIEGAQYTPFSRLKGLVRLRWFPKISLTFLPAVKLEIEENTHGRGRREIAGDKLMEIMTNMMFETTQYRNTLFTGLIEAKQVNGSRHVIVEDIEREPKTYGDILMRSFILARLFARQTEPGEHVGVLLPSMVTTSVVFFALQACGRVPAMLNFTVGAEGLLLAAETAKLNIIYTSRRFVENAKLTEVVDELARHVTVVYLEDLRQDVTLADKVFGLFGKRFSSTAYHMICPQRDPEKAAVVLFTSGSEGVPKGVVLSHINLQANRVQVGARVDFNRQDVVLNILPLFHSFGLTAGTLLPMLTGVKVFFYPSPLHYRIVPEIAYDINATILFGTNTFLKGYSLFAHPYDFYSLRYVFAGAEKLQEETRSVWAEKYGIRIFEGYGATETAPVLSLNTPMECKKGTVGRLLPTIEHQLRPVPGVAEGGRLFVKGPNVMMGYLRHEQPGVLEPTRSEVGAGWYDTGDIVTIDDEGYIRIQGRAKRFAKIGGEMVSLTYVEDLASECWPEVGSAVVALPDDKKGEQLILAVAMASVDRKVFLNFCRDKGVGELNIPKRCLSIKEIPVLGTGKTDYPSLQKWAEAL